MLSPLFTTVFDASVVNGGAIDAFVHALRLEHVLGLLLTGVVCAPYSNRKAILLLGVAMAGLLAGAVLTALGIALPFAAGGWVVALGVLAVCAALAGKTPAWLAGLAIAAYTVLLVNSHAIELQSRGTGYELSFLATFTICALGLVWMGLALAFMANRSRTGTLVMRFAGILIAVLGAFTMAGGM